MIVFFLLFLRDCIVKQMKECDTLLIPHLSVVRGRQPRLILDKTGYLTMWSLNGWVVHHARTGVDPITGAPLPYIKQYCEAHKVSRRVSSTAVTALVTRNWTCQHANVSQWRYSEILICSHLMLFTPPYH